jgi:predicted secreted protein
MKHTMKQGTDIKKKCSDGLRSIAANLTTHDKRDAAIKLGVHKNTVHNYLRGEVGDVDTGLKMLEFFNKRLSNRIEKMHKIIAA